MRKSVRIYLVVVAITITLMSQMVCGQQFYPNGRYGRRSSSPTLAESNRGREMLISFFGDNGVKCSYTGYSDLYRCNRASNKDEFNG